MLALRKEHSETACKCHFATFSWVVVTFEWTAAILVVWLVLMSTFSRIIVYKAATLLAWMEPISFTFADCPFEFLYWSAEAWSNNLRSVQASLKVILHWQLQVVLPFIKSNWSNRQRAGERFEQQVSTALTINPSLWSVVLDQCSPTTPLCSTVHFTGRLIQFSHFDFVSFFRQLGAPSLLLLVDMAHQLETTFHSKIVHIF